MKTKVIATASDDMMSVNIAFESDCPMVRSIGEINGINPYEAIGTPFTESEIYKRCAQCLRHTACPVPCAIVKAVEAEAGLGLKKPVSIEFE